MSTHEIERIVSRIGRMITLSGIFVVLVASVAASNNSKGTGPGPAAVWVLSTAGVVLLLNGFYAWAAFARPDEHRAPGERTDTTADPSD